MMNILIICFSTYAPPEHRPSDDACLNSSRISPLRTDRRGNKAVMPIPALHSHDMHGASAVAVDHQCSTPICVPLAVSFSVNDTSMPRSFLVEDQG